MEIEEFGLIEKEEVPALHFPQDEVLRSEALIRERNAALQRAIALGNLEHQKVVIYFSDDQGPKKINTTIWAVTEDVIVLKQNAVVPIHRIHKLEI